MEEKINKAIVKITSYLQDDSMNVYKEIHWWKGEWQSTYTSRHPIFKEIEEKLHARYITVAIDTNKNRVFPAYVDHSNQYHEITDERIIDDILSAKFKNNETVNIEDDIPIELAYAEHKGQIELERQKEYYKGKLNRSKPFYTFQSLNNTAILIALASIFIALGIIL